MVLSEVVPEAPSWYTNPFWPVMPMRGAGGSIVLPETFMVIPYAWIASLL